MKVFIKTYGCSFNFSDSEIMAGLIQQNKDHVLVDSIKKADVVIVNSCTVKEKAENKLWRDVREIKKPVIIAGCVPEAEKNKEKFKDYAVIGTYHIDKVVEVLDALLKGKKLQFLGRRDLIRVNLPKTRQNPIVEIVPINEGCLGKCDYCKTKFARGHLKSYPIQDIVAHVRTAVNSGAKQIWLTSQDTGCYGYDFATQQKSKSALQTSKFPINVGRKKQNSNSIEETNNINTNIVELLKEIIKIPKDFKIRLGMGNPDFLLDYIDDLIEVFKSDKIYKFIHIPIQSGSNHVIKCMKRDYTIEDFYKIVEKFKKTHPMITIASDMIVGYPDETDEDFEQSLDLIKKIQPDVLNISRFWYRPDTLAAKKKKLPTLTVKNRGIKITKVFHKTAEKENKKWLNWEGEVLIEERGLRKTWIGRNFAYRPVILNGDFKIGDVVKVKITDTTNIDLRGKII